MFCFRYGLGDGELQVYFRESLTLSLVVGVHFLLFLASQIQKEHSMEDLLNFLMFFLIRVLLKPSFLRQHKTDLEHYPLAPTSTAKSSTDHPPGSMMNKDNKSASWNDNLDLKVWWCKGKYLLILVLCHDSMFFSQGHVNSMSLTFVKALENVKIL